MIKGISLKKLFLLILFITSLVFHAPADDAEIEDLSYAFGMYFAWDLIDTGFVIDYEEFTRGFREYYEGELTRFSLDDAIIVLQTAFDQLYAVEMERLQIEGERNLETGRAFLAQNALRPGVIVTATGLQVEMLREGSGNMPVMSDMVTVHYRGTLLDGTVFDSSYDFGEALSIPLEMVIPGWSEGLLLMREGGRAMLYLPPELAYGDMNIGSVPPNSVLIFEVDFLYINDSVP